MVQLITLGTAVFTGTILGLVAILRVAESFLVNKEDCRIVINEDTEKPLVVPSGGTLLSALAANKIFLPSACGGGGTCAMCKCQVLAGGGDILPTEIGQIPPVEQKQGYRLACQVKIRQDMDIVVPEEIFNIKKFDCTVRSNNNVATFIKELVLELDAGETLDFKAGGYIQIYIPPYRTSFKEFDIESEYRGDWDKYNLWQYEASNDEEIFRAYSMANHPAEGNIVMLNVRIATPPPNSQGIPPGLASSYIFNLKPGDRVTVSGPYGEFFAKDTQREMIYIGGGAGMAPMRSHIFDLFHTRQTERPVSFWYGARSLREMFYEEEFREIERKHPNFSFHLALSEPLPEDRWEGPTGFIHKVLYENYLRDHSDPSEVEYYLCGPPPMIDAVNRMLYEQGVDPDMIAYDSFG